MSRVVRSFVSVLLVSSLASAHVAPALAATGALTKPEYESCQAREEQAFRGAIEAITVKAIDKGVADIDYSAIVADEWRKIGLDEIVDKRVDIAIDEVANETSWTDQLSSLANSEQAQKLAFVRR